MLAIIEIEISKRWSEVARAAGEVVAARSVFFKSLDSGMADG
jgi:hypothetical protein